MDHDVGTRAPERLGQGVKVPNITLKMPMARDGEVAVEERRPRVLAEADRPGPEPRQQVAEPGALESHMARDEDGAVAPES